MDRKPVIFTGCAPALITPFRNDRIDEESYLRLLERQIEGGCRALVVCGTTGESSALTESERYRLLSLTVRRCGGGIPVIAGAGSNDTRKSLELIRIAEEAGADGLLLVTPYYNKTTQRGLIAHYQYLADRTDLPVLLYEVPSRTGVTIEPETIAVLSRHPHICGIKEAGTDLDRISKAIRLCDEDFSFYSGNDSLALPMFSLGAKGLISVASNLLPKEIGRLCTLALAGEFTGAAELHFRCLDLMEALFSEVNPIPIKEALAMLGLCSAEFRLPLVRMAEEHRSRLKACMEALDLL